MIEKIRQRIAPIFEELEQERSPSVKPLPILAWLLLAEIIGALAPFIWITNHGLLVALSASILFIILTARPVLKRSIKKDD